MTGPLSLMTSPTSPRRQIERDWRRLLVRPGAARQHFAMALNDAWKFVELRPVEPGADAAAAEIGLARRTRGPAAEIGVYASLLSREVHPADWQSIWLAANRYRTVAGRRLPTAFGDAGDVLAERDVNGERYVYRSLAVKDGDRLFLALARCAFADYPTVEEEFLIALESFELIHPTREPFAEAMRECRIDAPAKGSFLFPESWTHKPDLVPLPGGSTFSAEYRQGGKVTGLFTFAGVPPAAAKTHQDLADRYIAELERNGVSVPRVPLGKTGIPSLRQADLPSEAGDARVLVRCGVVEDESGWILCGMLGPGADAEPETEAANRRAWEVALRSFQWGG